MLFTWQTFISKITAGIKAFDRATTRRQLGWSKNDVTVLWAGAQWGMHGKTAGCE